MMRKRSGSERGSSQIEEMVQISFSDGSTRYEAFSITKIKGELGKWITKVDHKGGSQKCITKMDYKN